MKKGDKVRIFEDPITRQKPEGMATLIKLEFVSDSVPRAERWRVRFEGDEPNETYSRTIFLE